jgi:hypothetical protein
MNLCIPSIILFTNPCCGFTENRSLHSSTFVVLLHISDLLNQKIHIVANFLVALPHLFVSLR